MRSLVLKDNMGQIIRVFRSEAKKAYLVYRKNKGRLDLCSSLDFFEKETVIPIEEWEVSQMQSIQPVPLIQGTLEFSDKVLNVRSPLLRLSESTNIWKICAFVVGIYACLIGSLYGLSQIGISEQSTKQEPLIVKIIKPPTIVQPEKVVIGSKQIFLKKSKNLVKKKILKRSLKKMGALSALGSLSKKNNRQLSGLNLGASKVSVGPGLKAVSGDSASGGVQDSLYSKGMISSALGSGGNIRGGGGHGTKGRQAGGGQAGYGEMILVGSGGRTEDLSDTSALDQQGGSFDFGIIDREIVKKIGLIRQCYDMALKTEPNLKGLFKIHFIINLGGKVAHSNVHPTSSTQSQKISSCILNVINNIRFPIQLTAAIGINYAFDLSALETEGG